MKYLCYIFRGRVNNRKKLAPVTTNINHQMNSKQHKIDKVKFFDSSYPMKWAFACWSWQIITVFIGFWLLVNCLPWDAIHPVWDDSDIVSYVNEIFNRYDRVPPPLRYSHLDEQFAVIGLFGIGYFIFVLLKTGTLPPARKNVPWWTAPGLCLSSGFLFLCLMFLITVDLSSSAAAMTEDSYQKWIADYSDRSSWEHTGRFIFGIHVTGTMLVYCIASLRKSINQLLGK